jgi:hypothetical protein
MAKRNNRRRQSLPTPWLSRLKLVYSLGEDSANPISLAELLYTVPSETGNIPTSLVVGGVNLTCTAEESQEGISDLCVAIMRIPQGFPIPSYSSGQGLKLIDDHPEWVIAYKYLGSPMISGSSQQFQPIRIRSNKRVRLYSGDRIAAVTQFVKDTTTGGMNFYLNGEVRGRSRYD